MQPTYTAGEVLEIAQQIERNGARFYRRAAGAAPQEEARRTLNELAVMEQTHERTFATMAAELTSQERQEPLYDPNDEAAQYMRVVAGGHVFDLRADPSEWLGPGRTMAQILRKAIEVEKESIIYYLGLKQAVPEHLGRERVDRIIAEEMRHLVLLDGMLGYAQGRQQT